MKKMYSTIAIDVDEVLVETAPGIIDYYNAKYGTSVTMKDYYSDNFEHWNVPDFATAVRQVNEFTETPEYMELQPTRHSVEVIKGLDKKYDLYIITGRPDMVSEITQAWLKKHYPVLFKDIVFTNFYHPEKRRTKGDICFELGVDLLVDDHPAHLVSVAEKGIDGFLFGDFPWSKGPKKLPANVRRVKDWEEVGRLLL